MVHRILIYYILLFKQLNNLFDVISVTMKEKQSNPDIGSFSFGTC